MGLPRAGKGQGGRSGSRVRSLSYFSSRTMTQEPMEPTLTSPPAKRPVLLTVICILSFIGGAWSIFSGIKTINQDPAVELAKLSAQMEEARAQMDGSNPLALKLIDASWEAGRKMIEKGKPLGTSGIVLAVISLYGVWRMWNLFKQGFWIYVLAAIGGVVAYLAILGPGGAVWAQVGVSALVSLVFIILYAVNLKHMH